MRGEYLLPGHVVGEGPHVLEQVGAVPALHVLHHHAQVLLTLKAAVHGDHKWVVSEGENVSLCKHLLNLECSNQILRLHLDDMSCFLFVCEQMIPDIT